MNKKISSLKKEKDLEKNINAVALFSLSTLRKIFIKHKLTDRESTLSMIYYIHFFITNGWKDNTSLEVLDNITEVIKEAREKK